MASSRVSVEYSRVFIRTATMAFFVVSFYAISLWHGGGNGAFSHDRKMRSILQQEVPTNETSPIFEEPPVFIDLDDPDNCSIYLMDHAEDKCVYVMTTPDCAPDGFVDYLQLHYCTLANAQWLSFIILLVILLILFYVLGSTAERFFCPALERVSEKLNMSPNVAGVTLLALGNGSPDIFATIAAVGQNTFAQALGEMIGAGMFVTTVVVGAVSIAAGSVPAKVTRRPFLRDIGFYLLSLIGLFVICMDHKITMWEAGLFIGVYVVYVCVVIIGRIIYQSSKTASAEKLKQLTAINSIDVVQVEDVKKKNESESDEDEPEDEPKETPEQQKKLRREAMMVGLDEEFSNEPMFQDLASKTIRFGGEDYFREHDGTIGAEEKSDALHERVAKNFRRMGVYLAKVGLWRGHRMHKQRRQRRKAEGNTESTKSLLSPDGEGEDEIGGEDIDLIEKTRDLQEGVGCGRMLWQQFWDYFDWEDLNLRQKITTIIDLPRLVIQHMTVPWADEEKFFRPFHVAHPIAMMLFCFTIFRAWDVQTSAGPLWPWILGVAVLLAGFIFLTSSNFEPPRYNFALVVIGMVMSILWIYLIANELVSLLNSAGMMLRVSNAIMGLTVLAWGNSVGDMISNVVVSKNGQPQMAIGACFAAPLTNLLLGIGISILMNGVKSGGSDYILGPRELKNNMFLGFIFLMFISVITVIIVPLSKFRFTRKYGIFLLVIYLAFTILSFLLEFHVILPGTDIWKLADF